MGEGEEIVEIGELWLGLDRRHPEILGNRRDLISRWRRRTARDLVLRFGRRRCRRLRSSIALLAEAARAGHDIQEPSHVRDRLLLVPVVLCACNNILQRGVN